MAAMDAALGYLELEAEEETDLRLNMRGQCLARHMMLATNASDVDRVAKLADSLLQAGQQLPAAEAAELRSTVHAWSRLKSKQQRGKHAQRIYSETDGVRTKAVNTLLTACIAALQTLPPEAFSPVRAAAPPPPSAAGAARDNREAAAPPAGGIDAAAKGEQKAASKAHKPPRGDLHIGRPVQQEADDVVVVDDGPNDAPPQPKQAAARKPPQAGGGAPAQKAAAAKVLPARKHAKPIVEEGSSDEDEGERAAGPSKAAATPRNLAPRDPDIDNACDVCGSFDIGTGKQVMLVCDGWNCEWGRHLGCCKPVLAQPPPGAWFCSTCTKWRSDGVPAATMGEIHKKYGMAAPVWRAMLHAFGDPTGSHNAVWLEARLKRGGMGGKKGQPQPPPRRIGPSPSKAVADASYEVTEDDGDDDDDVVMATLEPEVEVADPDVEPVLHDVSDDDADDDFVPGGRRGPQKAGSVPAARKLEMAGPGSRKAAPREAAPVPQGPPEPTVGKLTPGRVAKLAFRTSMEYPSDDEDADAEMDDPGAARRGGPAGAARSAGSKWTEEELVALGEGVRAHGTNWGAILQHSALLRNTRRQPAQLAEKYRSLEPAVQAAAAAGPSGKQEAKMTVVRKRVRGCSRKSIMFEEEEPAEPEAPEAKRQKTTAKKKAPPPPPPPAAARMTRGMKTAAKKAPATRAQRKAVAKPTKGR